MNNYKIIVISIWLVLCFTVRFIGLDKSPVSLNYDESALGYNAYSLMLTHKDEYGTKFPIALRSFNDYKPALYSYLSIPFVKYLGLSQTSTRTVSALFGTISLLFFFLIFRQITKSSFFTSFFIALFISLLPWRLHYSRVAFESNLSMSFFTIMFWSLINIKKNKLFYLWTIIFGVLSIYSYHGARLAVPFLLLFYFLDPLSKNFINKIAKSFLKILTNLWILLVFLIFYIPLFIVNDSSFVLRRYDQTNVFSRFYPYTPLELVKNTNPWLSLTNNPLYYLTGIITGHVLSYLSPVNLTNNIYHWVTNSAQRISGTGMLGWLASLFTIIGIWHWFVNLKNIKSYRSILYWLVAAATPVAVTYEWFHPLRSLNGFPAIEIICGLGIITIFQYLKTIKLRFVWITFLIIIMSISSIYNINNEYNFAIYDTNSEFQPGGYKEGASLLYSLKDKYQTVYLDSPHAQSYVMFLLYMKYPPENIQRYAAIRPPLGTEGFLNFNFDNFVFKKYDWLTDRKNKSFVYWTSSEVIEQEISQTPDAKLYKIYDPLGRWVTSIITKE